MADRYVLTLTFLLILESVLIVILYRGYERGTCFATNSGGSTDWAAKFKAASEYKLLSSSGSQNGSSLLELGLKFKTDKVFFHHYENLYEKHFSRYRGKTVRLLEIGLGCQQQFGEGASAKLWRAYLGQSAEIHFIEYDRKCGEAWMAGADAQQLNVKMHYGSQEDIIFLENFRRENKKFDIIIDDGGHQIRQQITSFEQLLPMVVSGGIYVIEDLQTSLDSNNPSVPASSSSTLGYIRNIVDDVQRRLTKKTTPIGEYIRSFEVGNNIAFFFVD